MKMTEMVLLMLVGYVCAKIKTTGPEFNKHASILLTNVLLPATILKSCIGVETAISNAEVFLVLLMYTIMMGISFVVGKLMMKVLPAKKREAGVLLCLVMYMNVAFIGFPMAEAVYGPEASFYACLSCMPFNALLFSAGTVTLRGDGGKIGVNCLLNAPMIATAIGIVLFLLSLPVPALITSTISSVGGATVPVSMIILGTSLAGVELKTAFSDWRVYVASLVRLVICPIIVYYVVGLFTENTVLLGTVTVLSGTPSAVALTALCIQYEVDEKLASKGIFISTVLSAVTLPFVIWLLGL